MSLSSSANHTVSFPSSSSLPIKFSPPFFSQLYLLGEEQDSGRLKFDLEFLKMDRKHEGEEGGGPSPD